VETAQSEGTSEVQAAAQTRPGAAVRPREISGPRLPPLAPKEDNVDSAYLTGDAEVRSLPAEALESAPNAGAPAASAPPRGDEAIAATAVSYSGPALPTSKPERDVSIPEFKAMAERAIAIMDGRVPEGGDEAGPPKPLVAEIPDDAENPREAYAEVVAGYLESFKRYPEAASARGEEGTAKVSFVVKPDGSVDAAWLVERSGHATLDAEALSLPRRAAPLPGFPDGIRAQQLRLTLPVSFYLE